MSSPDHGIVPSAFKGGIPVTFIAADGTAAKIIADATLPQAPSSTLARLIGGCTVIDFTAASTDAVAREIVTWPGTVYTTVGANTGTAATTTSTITRTTGDFRTDGWMPGDLVMMFAPTAPGSAFARTAGVDGVLGIVTTVAATTLTVNGTPFAAGTLTSGMRICKMAYGVRIGIGANAGTNGSSGTQALLGQGNDGSLLRYEKKLGANDVLAIAMQAAVSALPAYISIDATLALY